MALGLGPITRPVWLLTLAALTAVIVPLWFVLLRTVFAIPMRAKSLIVTNQHNILAQIVLIALATVGAALAEELFFRGWFWQALRQRWRVLPVAVASTGLWLLVHLGEGWSKPLILLPVGVLLALARQRCGGLAASMLLHLLNNLAGIAFLLLTV